MRSSGSARAPLAAALVAAGLLAGCTHRTAAQPSNASVTLPRPSGGSPDQPPVAAVVPEGRYLGERMLCIDRELERLRLNAYGDPLGTTYANGSPLRSQVTGTITNRYDYVLSQRPDIAATCNRAPLEPER